MISEVRIITDSKFNFKELIIQAVLAIPDGRVTTYGTIALLANTPRGARLVGGILQTNSAKYNLPWYRVVNKDGCISIRSAEHSKELQKSLLESEGIEVSDGFMVDLDKYGWWG